MSTVENFQNTALQLLALTASMFVNRSYGYLTCLKAHLLADPKESANFISFFQSEYCGEYRGDSTHYSTQSRCCFCTGNFDFKCLLCTLTINKQFK